jgi:O-antigen/teichoic acid export membrane protein
MISYSRITDYLDGKKEFSLKINTLSNFFGNAWAALTAIIFLPINLHYLGVEAYGIIGIFNSLQAFVWLLDLGMSGVISRELPQIAALPHKTQEILDLTRTTGRINWLMGTAISLFLVAMSPLIGNYWLQGNQLSPSTVTQSLMIMSAGFITQWAIGFYNNGLAALQKQTLLNLINVIFTTIRNVGGVLVLIFVSSTIQAFLIWQIVIGSIQLLIAAMTFRRCLPQSFSGARFRWSLLKSRFGFASGLTIMSVLGLILHQLDKIILSRLLTLEFFGYYTIATTITTLGLGMIPRSIAGAVYPRFSYLVSINDEDQLRTLYHRITQIMAAVMLPAAAVLIVFPYETLMLWTRGDEAIAANAWLLVSVLTVGVVLNGFYNVPFYLQLAHGWTKIIIVSATIAIFLITPTMIYSVIQYGAIAGAVCWAFLNLFHLLVDVTVMHRFTLKGEQWKWYFVDILKPFAIVLSIAFLCKLIFKPDHSRVQIFLTLCITAFITYICTGLAMEFTRNWLLETYKTYLNRLVKKENH